MKNSKRYLKRFVPSKVKMVRVLWLDAAFDSTGTIKGGCPLKKDYLGGCVDSVVGYLIGETPDFLVLGHSYYGDSVMNKQGTFRHVWDIPKSWVLKVEELVVRQGKR